MHSFCEAATAAPVLSRQNREIGSKIARNPRTMTPMIGERVREIRQAQGRSLADVAGKAKVSVATLSRIENHKQSLDLDLFLDLAKVLHVNAAEMLPANGDDEGDPLARRISRLDSRTRTELWRDLAQERRTTRDKRAAETRNLGAQVEELVAQIEFLREELELVRKRVKRR
jgi:transcriptional regulator with XRE-family HTH domain